MIYSQTNYVIAFTVFQIPWKLYITMPMPLGGKERPKSSVNFEDFCMNNNMNWLQMNRSNWIPSANIKWMHDDGNMTTQQVYIKKIAYQMKGQIGCVMCVYIV